MTRKPMYAVIALHVIVTNHDLVCDMTNVQLFCHLKTHTMSRTLRRWQSDEGKENAARWHVMNAHLSHACMHAATMIMQSPRFRRHF